MDLNSNFWLCLTAYDTQSTNSPTYWLNFTPHRLSSSEEFCQLLYKELRTCLFSTFLTPPASSASSPKNITYNYEHRSISTTLNTKNGRKLNQVITAPVYNAHNVKVNSICQVKMNKLLLYYKYLL